MSTEVVTPQVEPTPPEPPKVFKARREIPIRDKDGNLLGGVQVYEAEGATQAEADQRVIDKMAEAIEHGTRKIREFSLLRKNGGIEAPKIPEGADIETDSIPDPKPRQLTEAELLQINQDLRDPVKMQDAYDRLYEARTGLKPIDDAKLKQEQRLKAKIESATAAAEAFSRDNPEFYGTTENKKAMMDYMVARDAVLQKEGKSFPWTKKNLEIAYRELKAEGLLAEKPPTPVPDPAPPRTEARPVEVVEEVKQEEPPARKVDKFPSAIRPSSASGAEQKPKPKGPSARELAMMSPKQLKDYYESHGLWGK